MTAGNQMIAELLDLLGTLKSSAAGADPMLGLALALVFGYTCGRLARLVRLPSITGYIIAGLVIGPSGFGFISEAMVSEKLRPFTDIALMLIAFGIGEKLNLAMLKRSGGGVLILPLIEASLAFTFVFGATWLLGSTVSLGVVQKTGPASPLIAACLLGAIAMATAPATTLAMVRELGAIGPVSRALVASVAIDNAMAIGFFALFARLFSDPAHTTIAMAIPGGAAGIILGSLLWGALIAWFTHFALAFTHRQEDVQIISFGTLLLMGSLAGLMGLSPMLAGITAGFVIVNHHRQDTRAFEAINKLESPIYVVFFVLAGAHLSLPALWASGALGVAFILARALGKYYGAQWGAKLIRAHKSVRYYLGPALIPQAGVAVGLVFALQQMPSFDQYAGWMTDVVLTGVAVAELIGPVLVKHSLEKCAELCSMSGESFEDDVAERNTYGD